MKCPCGVPTLVVYRLDTAVRRGQSAEMRILVVEDEIKVARFIERGLKEERFAVDVAPDGEEGLHLARVSPMT